VLVWKKAGAAKARIPAGQRIYAVGDIHGRADLLAAVLKRIDDDLRTRPIAESLEIFLGDYIDRGPQSRTVVDILIGRRQQHRMVLLKGNHEIFAIEIMRNPAVLDDWIKMGGLSTLLSYGVELRDRGSIKETEIAGAFRRALPESHQDFFLHLTASFSCGDFFFAHAGVRPGIPLHQQREQDLLWIRDEFLSHEEEFGKIVVHGHSPSTEPEFLANRINIDTGAYATGRLTCLVLEGDEAVCL
jgi:serine/threonine protein phosphatase 1